jgi:CheY-like chemotaxis protein
MGIFNAAVALFSTGGVGQREELPHGADANSEPKTKCTILIIDDDPSFLETNRPLLRSAGYNVLTSTTGPKGLDMVRYAPRDIRLVLLDYNMPRFNGAETLEFLRKLNPALKIIAVSGFRVTELPESFHAGVDRFVSKPFNNDELLKAVAEVLESSSAIEAPVSVSR